MALNGSIHSSGLRIPFLTAYAITAAETNTVSAPIKYLTGMNYVSALAVFTYGSGGTSAKFYLQTSYDGATTWVDIMAFAFAVTTATKVSSVCTYIAPAAQAAAPTDGSLTDNTIIQGTLGSYLRLKYTTVGIYAATTISLNVVVKG